MVTKIVGFFMFSMLIFAFFLAIIGVKQITTGEEYYTFLQTVNERFVNWKLEIPDIPKINQINQGGFDDSGLILQVLIKIANFFVNFVNIFTSILNVLILVVNVVIQVLQFIFTLIYSLKDLINRLGELNTST